MKQILATLLIVTTCYFAASQEQLPRREALKYAFLVSADLKTLQNTPITTDVDLKQPVALRDGDYGALLLPESKLTADAIAKAGEQIVPIGQLWLHKLTPMRESGGVPSHQLRLVRVVGEEESGEAVQCALGVKSNGAGGLDLLVFGKERTPLLKVPLKQTERTQQLPIALRAEREYESGRLTLNLLGRYEASFRVTELEF
ncbi:MAG: hypothetical protein KIS67_14275 [Verrucomicrobiae bacterium]|nr:hypothetical protein [Verrucomicrobiae bacterium]